MKRYFKVTASKDANKKSIKASKQDYELINYFDVWGNPEDGFDVNDLDRTGEIITITDDATDEDIIDGLINMGFLKSDAKGKIYVEDMGDGFIELSVEETGEPIGRLELVTAAKKSNKKSIKASNSKKRSIKSMRNINASSNGGYDYMEAMVDDIKEWVEDNIDASDFDDRDALEEQLNDDLWVDDSVTGNGSGSYTFNRAKAKEYVVDNMDLLGEMIQEFDIDAKTVGEKFIEQDWEYFDVSIRCYLLGQAIGEALDQLDLEFGTEDEDEEENEEE